MVDMILPFIITGFILAASAAIGILWDIQKNVRIIADKFKQSGEEGKSNGQNKKK